MKCFECELSEEAELDSLSEEEFNKNYEIRTYKCRSCGRKFSDVYKKRHRR